MRENETIEDVRVRCERQRERAERWTVKYSVLEGENESLRKQRQELDDKIDQLFVEYEALLQQTEHEKDQEIMDLESQVWKANGITAIKSNQAYKDGFDKALEVHKRALVLGKKELKKNYEKRLQAKVDKLIKSELIKSDKYDDELQPVQWLRRAIKRVNGVSGNCPVVMVPGGKGKGKCEYKGEFGYHTTPSGKTVVNHPGSYGYRTVYHKSTERLEVDVKWIYANIKKLAMSEAKMRVKK